MFRCLAAILILQLSLLSTADAADADAKSMLDAFEAATLLITSYDVVVESKLQITAKAVKTGTRLQDNRPIPTFTWEPLPPGVEPTTRTYLSRQVFSSDGRWRFDRFVGPDYGVAKVFNGDSTRYYSLINNFGIIVSIGPEQKPFPHQSENYAALFHRVFLGGELVKLFREREVISTRPSSEFPGQIELTTAAQEGANMYPAFTFRLVLDPEHGMLPTTIEANTHGLTPSRLRIQISKFHQLDGGAWVPVEAQISDGSDKLTKNVSTLRVNVAQSSWNVQPDEATFTLAFPAGTQVHDEERKKSFILKNEDPGTTSVKVVEESED